MKVSVIGGGSTYTPELVDGLLSRQKDLPPMELSLYDIDAKRLQIVGGLCQRMVKGSRKLQVTLASARRDSLEGANFVVIQIRVGGQEARQKDTLLGLSHGLIGQETVGIGGFSKALRTIPVVLEIARELQECSPRGVILNFTNPAGMVTEALNKYSRVAAVGLCNIPWLMKKDIANYFKWDPSGISFDYVGLNHLSWARRISYKGKDVTAKILQESKKLGQGRYPFPKELIQSLGMLPSPYLQYYYDREGMVKKLKSNQKTRAQEVMAIEKALLKIYQNPRIAKKPKELEKRGGIYYGEAAASLMTSLLNSSPEVHILNYPNKVFPWLPPDAVIEAPFLVSSTTLKPVSIGEVELPVRGLISLMKAYEALTIEAAIHGDRDLAYQALLLNPLVGNANLAHQLLSEIIKLHKPLLPQFR